MDCDKAMYRVYHYLDGEMTVWRRWSIRRHLGKCPPCAQGFDFEIELRNERLRIYEGAKPSSRFGGLCCCRDRIRRLHG